MMQQSINQAVIPLSDLINSQSHMNNVQLAQGQVLVTKQEQQCVNTGLSGDLMPAGLNQGYDTDGEKRAIYRHPLFPLMALLLEKCELAAQSPDPSNADSFDVDIQSFVREQEQKNKPFLSDDPELDNLMLKSIQVLRIHLLELEKVTDLCQDFCNRYISCLKGKLQSDSLLRVDNVYDEGDEGGMMGAQTPTQGAQGGMGGVGGVGVNQGQLVSGGTVYQMVQTPQGIVAQPIQVQTVQPQTLPQQQPQQQQLHTQLHHHQMAPHQQMAPQVTSASIIHGSTPLSKIGVPATPPQNINQNALSCALGGDEDENGQSPKRGVLPKQATAIMKSWLFQHIIHPYPTEDEKRQIAQQTNLSLLQVNNWFINARRRILQPMLDSSDPSNASYTKTKKNKPQQARPMQRFWPESIANLQPQTSPTAHDSTDTNSASNTPTEEKPMSYPTSTPSLQIIAHPDNDGQQSTPGGSPGTIHPSLKLEYDNCGATQNTNSHTS